jgi:PAS domain S-box-containing protein
MKSQLSNLIDTEKSQRLLDSFCDAVGIAAAVIDLDGEVLVGSRWQKICTDFHRANEQTLKKCIESDTLLANEIEQGKQFTLYQCRNGLTNAASPIIIEGEHVANAFVGQFFLESPDRDFFLGQAAAYNFKEADYLDSLNKVPIVVAEKLPAVLNFLTTFAEMVAGMGIDRLKRIEATDALKESEAIFRTIVEHSNEMFYVHDTEHVLTYASPTSKNLLGYTSEEMMINWTKLTTDNPINQEGVRFTEKAISTGEKQAPYLLELKKKNGALVLVEIDESPVKDISGKVVAISGALRDVTEQKRTQQKLLKSEKGFRDLFDAITDLIYTQDLEGRFISVNHAMSSLFGYEKDAFTGKRASDFMKPELRPCFKSEYLEKIKTEGFVEGVSVYYLKAGREIYIEYRSSLVKPKDGTPYISGTGRDVTERVLSRKKIKRLQKQIVQSQKMEAMGLMAGGVAHDLNNILSGIVSYPELLLLGLPEDSPLKGPIRTIYESGKRAAEVVEDLLTMARGVATGKEVLSLNNTVNEYMESLEYRNLAETYTAVGFKTELAADLLSMSGSHSHIRKALMNLVINASEAIEGSGTVTIATLNRYLDEPLKGYRDVHTGEYVMLTVSDDGSGISPEDLERIFEPFYTKKVMGRSGTGLGLAVVWNTVQEHNGYINVESSGAGTIFELYFPVTRDERISKNEPVPLKDYLGHGEKILVVDDEEGQREIACNMLTKLGYIAEAVSSGEEAVQYVKESPVDLIVLDMIMPKGMNGRETYQEIMKIHPSQKAVIASGYAKTLDVDVVKKLGTGYYIKKPYTLEKIGVAVKNELNG